MGKMGPTIRKKNRTYTYADYLSWSEDERWELIDGVAYKSTVIEGFTLYLAGLFV
jgi:hypothetical protein